MTPHDRATLTALLVELCGEMFAPGGPLVELTEGAAPTESRLAASVGLSASDLRGALTIVARSDFFRATYPPELGAPRPEDLEDWAREAVNQLLGRLKNRFAAHGITFSISTPTVVRGEHLRLCPVEESTRISRALGVGGERVDVHFHIERDDGKGLLERAGPPVATSAEGAALLF